MILTRAALSNPTAVVVGVLLIVLFGLISLFRLPIQLTPDISQPTITINTSWRAAAPEEIESEIIEPQEDVLKGLQGLERMESSAGQGRGSITLRYITGTSMQRALLDVMNRLNQVPSYPRDANEATISVGGNSRFAAIAWFAVRTLPDNNRNIKSYQDFVAEVVQPRLERVPGVATTGAFGGSSKEIRVTFDPYRAAALGLDIPAIASAVGGNNDISGGFSHLGRRKYTLRFKGAYSVEQLQDMVLEWRDGKPIFLGDVASIALTLQDSIGDLTLDGGLAIAINAQPEQGVNIIKVNKGLQQAMQQLNEGELKRAGLSMIQMYDETIYVGQAMQLVRNNMLLGIFLAIIVLWWFLRKFLATLVVAAAIPISVIATFMALDLSGRSLNIISMAGIAFAVGMVLDAAIVVLESIVRQREKGLSPDAAAKKGTEQVWGALLASTITTVAIFLPIVFLEDIAGQLFADLAVAIAVAVVTSLIVALTVLPTATKQWISQKNQVDPHAHWWTACANTVMVLTASPVRRWFWIVSLSMAAVIGAYSLFPKADYLPKGNQNSFRAFILPPPGISLRASQQEMSNIINSRIRPYLSGAKLPKIDHTWMGIFGSFGFMGGRAESAEHIKEIVTVINKEILAGFPDTIAFANQAALFRGVGGGRSIDIDIQGTDIDELLAAAKVGMSAIRQALPGASIRPVPGLALAEPELRMIPNERRIAEAGWTRKQLGAIAQALGQGLFVGEFFDGDMRRNIILRANGWQTPEQLAALPLYTPNNGVQAMGDLVEFVRTAGPSQLRRVDRRRTVTLQVTPPDNLSLEESITALQTKAAPLIAAQLSESSQVKLRGTAESLAQALKNMGRTFILAIVILFLLMAALFRSFRDSLWVIATIPLATVGGILSLRLVDYVMRTTGSVQPLDLLTMIGFIILLGLVVNNAILLVHQTRSSERAGFSRTQAVEQAIKIRLRPILMSTLTSIFGMLPLLLVPGAGAELYRGIAAVIVGGMLVSTIFTLIFLPSLLRMGSAKNNSLTMEAI